MAVVKHNHLHCAFFPVYLEEDDTIWEGYFREEQAITMGLRSKDRVR